MTTLMQAGRPIAIKPLFTGNGYLVRQVYERWDSVLNDFVPWLDAALAVTISSDAAGTTPVAGLADIPLVEIGAQAPGVYANVIPGAQLAALSSLAGTIVYQVVRNTSIGDVLIVQPLRVTAPRYAQ